MEGLGSLRPDSWYLVNCNHRSWVDIFVLQRVLNRRIPLLKFFLKRELIWVPVIGLAWWALDFPFMQRRGGASGEPGLTWWRFGALAGVEFSGDAYRRRGSVPRLAPRR